MLQHVDGHAAQIVVRHPTPFTTGTGVVHLVGPALGNALLQRVHLVFHLSSSVPSAIGQMNFSPFTAL